MFCFCHIYKCAEIKFLGLLYIFLQKCTCFVIKIIRLCTLYKELISAPVFNNVKKTISQRYFNNIKLICQLQTFLQHRLFLVLLLRHGYGPFPAFSQKCENFINFSSYVLHIQQQKYRARYCSKTIIHILLFVLFCISY